MQHPVNALLLVVGIPAQPSLRLLLSRELWLVRDDLQVQRLGQHLRQAGQLAVHGRVAVTLLLPMQLGVVDHDNINIGDQRASTECFDDLLDVYLGFLVRRCARPLGFIHIPSEVLHSPWTIWA